jgi:hypothetical protein
VQLLGSTSGFDEFRVVSGALDSDRFLGLYRRGDRAIAAIALNAAKALLVCRPVLERNASWDDALRALGSTPDTAPTEAWATPQPASKG